MKPNYDDPEPDVPMGGSYTLVGRGTSGGSLIRLGERSGSTSKIDLDEILNPQEEDGAQA
jgi:hypothetical protein